MHLKHALLYFIQKDEDPEEFALWAFGERFRRYVGGFEFCHAWNNLHEKDLHLSTDGIFAEDIQKMLELWRRSKNVGST